MRYILALLAAVVAGSAMAQLPTGFPLPQCQVNPTCPYFISPGFQVGVNGILFNDGSHLYSASGGSATPSGPAGGDLTGTYPNPTLTTSGISAATYGSATQCPQVAFDAKGRATSATNVTITPAAASIQAGSLGAAVIASSIAASGVTVGTYGSATQASQVTVGVDGRVTAASNVTITGVPAATVPASGVQAGSLGASVIASSIAASGVTAGTYGSATQASQVTVGGDGRVTSAANVTVTPAAASIQAGTLGTGVIARAGQLLDASTTVQNSVDTTKTLAFDLTGQSSGAGLTISPLFGTNKTLYFQPSIASSSGNIVTQDADGRVYLGTTVALGGSNSGIQYSTLVSNRAQIRTNAFGNHAGVSGMTCAKSRGTTIGDNQAVQVGDSQCRITVQGGATTSGSLPINSDMSWVVNSVQSLTVATDLQLRLMNKAGSLGTRMYLTSEGALGLNEGTTPAAALDVASVSASSVTAILKGAASQSADMLQIQNSAGTNLVRVDQNGNLTGVSSVTASAFFGNPSQLSAGYVITASSYVGGNVSVASVSFVGIATATTPSLRGGRPLEVRAETNITNGAGGNRTYSCQLLQDGVLVDAARLSIVNAAGSQTIPLTYFTSSSSSGVHTYAIVCLTNNATATQTAAVTYVVAKEF